MRCASPASSSACNYYILLRGGLQREKGVKKTGAGRLSRLTRRGGYPNMEATLSTAMFIFTVPQGHCAIIEMFGKPISIRKSGLQFKIPVLQNLKNVSEKWGSLTNQSGVFIKLSEQVLDTNPRSCITKDNATMTADCVIRWRITDPIKAVYDVDNVHHSLIELVLNEMRSLIGGSKLDEILSARTDISEKIVLAAAATAARWGINITAVEIRELKTDDQTQEAMLKQMEAERVSRAIALEAHGKSEATLRLAEAEKQAAILKAQGASEALRLVTEAEAAYVQRIADIIGAEAAAKVLMNKQALEGYATISSNPADKVYLPNSVPAVLDLMK